MADENTIAHGVDGGDPTDEEARLAAQVDTIGENPDKEPDETAGADAAAAGDAAGKKDGETEDAVAAAGTAGADADAAAAAAAAADAAAAPAPAPAASAAAPAPAATPPPAAAPPRPEAPKDFKAELAALQKQYDDGELEPAQFQEKQWDLAREQARYDARVELWEERTRTAQESAAELFNAAAVAWEAQNKDFMDNPLRANAMQQAVLMVDKEQPGLPPDQLLAKAGKIVFDAYNWKPTPSADEAAAARQAEVDAAVAARKPGATPQTLASAPAASAIESRGNAAFQELDGKDISDLEDMLARMPEAQREAYLRDAPGANTNDPSPRDRDQ